MHPGKLPAHDTRKLVLYMLRTNYSGSGHTTAQQKSIQHENVVLKHMYIFLIGYKKKKKKRDSPIKVVRQKGNISLKLL